MNNNKKKLLAIAIAIDIYIIIWLIDYFSS